MEKFNQITMNKLEETKSWIITFFADISVDIALGFLIGVSTALETGNLTQATLIAILTASVRSGIKGGMSLVTERLKQIKNTR